MRGLYYFENSGFALRPLHGNLGVHICRVHWRRFGLSVQHLHNGTNGGRMQCFNGLDLFFSTNHVRRYLCLEASSICTRPFPTLCAFFVSVRNDGLGVFLIALFCQFPFFLAR